MGRSRGSNDASASRAAGHGGQRSAENHPRFLLRRPRFAVVYRTLPAKACRSNRFFG
ncbi:hypothetical protein [Azospirillum palustre]